MSVCEELLELVPAYALNALDPAERKRIEQHLRDCPELRDEIAAYQSVSTQLAYAPTQTEPRPALKYRVLDKISPQTKREFTPFGWLGSLVRSPAFAAIALIAAIGLGLWNIAVQSQLMQQVAQDQKLLTQLARERDLVSVMAYGQGQPRELQGTEIASRASGRLYGKADQSTFVLAVHNLPKLEPGKVYQVWLVSASGDRTSGGTFALDESAYGWIVVKPPKPLSEYRSIGITVEPEGGSPGPTTPRVMGTSL